MNMLARLLGFLRETAVAAIYGASAFTDAYQVAYTIPYFLQMVLGMALVSSIVPVVVRNINAEKTDEAWQVASITINLTAVLMLFLSIFGILGAKQIVEVTAPGFADQTLDYAVKMTKIMFPSIIFMSTGMLITGILNARQKFAVAAFAPAVSSMIIILGVLLFGRQNPYALPVASLVSFIGFLLVQIPALRKTGFRYSFSFDLHNQQVRGIFVNLMAIFIGTATYQIYLAINRFFASSLAEGSISALNYAGKLMNLPLGVFVSAVSSAIFPLLAVQALESDKSQMAMSINRGLKMVLLVTLPAAAGLMALRVPVIQLLFERGAFDHQATLQTASALLWFGPGMGAMAATQILTRAYYALGNTRTPLIMGLSSIAVNILASILLIPVMQQGGLALANSLASLFNALGMYVMLSYHLQDRRVLDLLKSLAKILVASVATGISALAVCDLLQDYLVGINQSLALLSGVLVSIGVGVLVYVAALWIMKEEEHWNFVRQILQEKKISNS